jgi:Fe-S-cluster containining protein
MTRSTLPFSDFLPASDSQLVQIIDAALQSTAARSGPWLACKPGCNQCCVGVFSINQLDAARLRAGLAQLASEDPDRADCVQQRVSDSEARLAPDFPGDPLTGILDDTAEALRRFESFANDEVCPVLDPITGACDLYAARPMTCRVFGPPVRNEEGLGVCELCYRGATPENIAACEMVPDPDDLESRVLEELEHRNGKSGETIIAFAFHGRPASR